MSKRASVAEDREWRIEDRGWRALTLARSQGAREWQKLSKQGRIEQVWRIAGNSRLFVERDLSKYGRASEQVVGGRPPRSPPWTGGGHFYEREESQALTATHSQGARE